MEIIAPVTDYMKGSLLAAQGDLVKHDGVDASRFGIGVSLQLLGVNDGGTDLIYTGLGNRLNYDHKTVTHMGGVTITDAATSIATLVLSYLTLGSFIFISAWANMAKFPTAGKTALGFRKSAGTGELFYANGRNSILDSWYHEASFDYDKMISAFARVETEGTYTIDLYGISWGSDVMVNHQEAVMDTWHVR